jgi:protein O-mannosyl-transferase
MPTRPSPPSSRRTRRSGCAPRCCSRSRARVCGCCGRFFAWLLPTNSLVPRLDVVNDRQLYLALVGPAWLLGLALAPLAERRPRLALLGLAVLGVVLALATAGHNRVYATEVAFWEDVARKSPGNARAANNLGYAYALACRDADALREFRRSQRLDPADYRAAINLRLLSEGALFTDNARHCPPAPGPGGEAQSCSDTRSPSSAASTS